MNSCLRHKSTAANAEYKKVHGHFEAENVQDLCQVMKWNLDQECPLKAKYVQNLVPGPHATGKLYRHKGLEVGVVFGHWGCSIRGSVWPCYLPLLVFHSQLKWFYFTTRFFHMLRPTSGSKQQRQLAVGWRASSYRPSLLVSLFLSSICYSNRR